MTSIDVDPARAPSPSTRTAAEPDGARMSELTDTTVAEAVRVIDVAPLIEHLDRRDRHPAVIVSPRRSCSPRYGLAPHRLARRCAGRATVWMLDTPAVAQALRGARREYATYGGAVRVIDPVGGGRIIRTDVDAADRQTMLNRIDAAIAAAIRADTPASPAGDPTPESGLPGTDDADLTLLRATVTTRDRELAQARAALATAREQLHALRATDDTETAPWWSSVVYADQDRQLRHEITQTWLHHLPEGDRDGWPLRPYRFGPGFVHAVETPLVSRQRILDVVVDVLTRRAYTMSARNAHPQHRGPATIHRADGATAYRAYVRHGTPGAPRVLWWECVDGSVELAWIGHHDDPLP